MKTSKNRKKANTWASKLKKWRRKFYVGMVNRDPEMFVRALSRSRITPRFRGVEDLPKGIEKIDSFEDCVWLFSCNQSNRAIARLDLDEAALLFRTVHAVTAPKIIEVGRFRGGSTIIMGAAADDNAHIKSIDIAPQDDEMLKSVLDKAGISHKVEMLVADANTIEAPDNTYDVIFLDGDHAYQAVSRDYEHWKKSVKVGGTLLFHDATMGRPMATMREGVQKLMKEIAQKDGACWQRCPDVGSIASWTRTETPWPNAA